MNHRIRVVLALFLLVSALSISSPVSARRVAAVHPAASPTWSSRIAYTNPTSAATQINVTYVESNGAVTTSSTPIDAPAHSSGIILAGSVNGGTGSAVVSAGTSILAVYEQFAPTSATELSQPLYDAFDSSQAGSTIFIPYFLYKYTETGKASALASTTVGVQNIAGSQVSVTISALNGVSKTQSILAQASYVFTGADLGLKPSYRGPLTITTQDGSSSIVAAAMLAGSGLQRVLAFEGQSPAEAAQSVYFSRPGCTPTTPTLQGSFFIQNTSADTATSLNVTFYSKTGAPITPKVAKNFTSLALAAGAMRRIDLCGDASLRGKVASLKVDSTATPIVGVGVIKDSLGVNAAYTGQILPASNSSYTYVLPYVTWKDIVPGSTSNTPITLPFIRTQIDVLNIGPAAANVTLNYYLQDGTLQVAQPLPINSNTHGASSPSLAAALVNNVFEGSVTVTSDQPLIITATRSHSNPAFKGASMLSDDYTARLFQ